MIEKKKIYGLLGYPVKHSLSPAMHNAAFRALGIDAEYRLFEVKPGEIDGFLNNLEKNNIYGLNVTIPHKVVLLKNKTIQTDHSCILAGAANILKREGDRLVCYNTDIYGFISALREDLHFDTRGKNIFILGCGGASRAVVAGLINEGMEVKKIYLYDINKDAIESAKKHFDSFLNETKGKIEYLLPEKDIPIKIENSNLLINASPVGMKEGDSSVINKAWLHDKLSVFDLVYNRETQLIKDAKEKERPVVNGLGMLLYQGMLSFKIWTGKPAPKEVMEKALSDALRA